MCMLTVVSAFHLYFVLQTLYLMHRLGLESESKVAVWTEKQFILLLTGPQGSQGCQKMR